MRILSNPGRYSSHPTYIVEIDLDELALLDNEHPDVLEAQKLQEVHALIEEFRLLGMSQRAVFAFQRGLESAPRQNALAAFGSVKTGKFLTFQELVSLIPHRQKEITRLHSVGNVAYGELLRISKKWLEATE